MDFLDSLGEYMGDEEKPVEETDKKEEVVEEEVTLANFESDEDGNVVPSIQSPANSMNEEMQRALKALEDEEDLKELDEAVDKLVIMPEKTTPKRYNPKKKSKKRMAKQSRMKNRKKK